MTNDRDLKYHSSSKDGLQKNLHGKFSEAEENNVSKKASRPIIANEANILSKFRENSSTKEGKTDITDV